MVVIRHARASDAARLAEFGRRTFLDTFASQNTAEDMAAHTASAFGEARQRSELADPGTTTLIAEEADAIVGYAHLRIVTPPDCVMGPDPIELVRFYIDRDWHGHGIAQVLMREVEAVAATRGGTLWLGVWERNDRAKAFYAKCGFTTVGSHVFLLGSDAQTDHIMMKLLSSSPTDLTSSRGV